MWEGPRRGAKEGKEARREEAAGAGQQEEWPMQQRPRSWQRRSKDWRRPRPKQRKQWPKELTEARQVREGRRLQESGEESSGASSMDRSACSQVRQKMKKRRAEKGSKWKVLGRRAAAERRVKEKDAEESEDEEWKPTQKWHREQFREQGIKECVKGLSKKGMKALKG